MLGIVACVLFTAALLGQLARLDALAGGRPSGRLYPAQGPLWLHLVVNHVTVSWTSRAVDTVAPLLLLGLAAWLSARYRRCTPLVCVCFALALVVVVLVAGKGFLGRAVGEHALVWSPSRLSGPATVVVVVAGLAVWLLREQLTPGIYRRLWGLAASFAVVIGATQLYLRHQVDAVLVSWAAGLLVLGVVLLIFGGPSARRWWVPR